jgi:hypothetical protein
MYCICETNSNKKRIIKLLNKQEEFNDYVKSLNKDVEFIDNIISACLGSHLLQSENKIELIEKFEDVSVGRFYNTVTIATKVVVTYELIQYDLDEEKTEFPLFDINNTRNSLTHIISPKESYKSNLLTKIIDNLITSEEFLNNMLIISPSEHLNPYFQKKYKNAKVIYKLNHEIIQEFINKPSSCIILDNCLSIIPRWKSVLSDLLSNYKKYNSTVIITSKYLLNFGKNVCDNVICFEQTSAQALQKIYQYYFEHIYNDSNKFKNDIDEYSVLVYSNNNVFTISN